MFSYNLVPIVDIYELEKELAARHNYDFNEVPLAEILFGDDYSFGNYYRFDIADGIFYDVVAHEQARCILKQYYPFHDYVLINCYW